MDYQSALDYVLGFADYERLPRSAVVFDLRRIEALLQRLGNPHQQPSSVHIAGTKGKGSTAAMIASVLTRAGYHTGLYTSPHLNTLRERMQIDGKPISEEEFAQLTAQLKPEIEAINLIGEFGQLTTFEILTALAMVYFKEKAVDFQVLEAGLGGRLDATNVVEPKVSVITSISYDHTDVLGNTLTEIAREKAGIIKPKSIVVSSPQHPEAMAMIERVCYEKEARLIRVGQEVTWQEKDFCLFGANSKNKLSTRSAILVNGRLNSYQINIPLLGEHQMENAATALAVLEVLIESGVRISPNSIIDGMAQVHWPGRLQILSTEPLFIVDGAHNADSARRLREAIRKYFQFEHLILIIGSSDDKDIAGIIGELASIVDGVIVTQSRHPRATPASKLIAEFSHWGVHPRVAEDMSSAITMAQGSAGSKDLICVTGSIFIVAEAIEYLEKLPAERYPKP
jgi:dihydrofolate synthase/folylpolyglutamate synthase